MKKTLLLLITFVISFSIYGQELMTIGEVFNFEIGDKFQIKGTADNEPPNADRFEIIEKYFSTNKDTLSYIRFHDSYFTYVEGGALYYHFWTKTDTVSYTKLDSSIAYFDQDFELNRYVENSSALCDSLINGNAYESGPEFENDYTINEYGKGLGKTRAYFYSGQGRAVLWHNSLFYYKKGDYECGSPDSTTVGVHEENIQDPGVLIYPNPTKSEINIIDKSQSGINQCSIINSVGQRVMTLNNIKQEQRINLSQLEKGIYFLQLKYEEYTIVRKIIKE